METFWEVEAFYQTNSQKKSGLDKSFLDNLLMYTNKVQSVLLCPAISPAFCLKTFLIGNMGKGAQAPGVLQRRETSGWRCYNEEEQPCMERAPEIIKSIHRTAQKVQMEYSTELTQRCTMCVSISRREDLQRTPENRAAEGACISRKLKKEEKAYKCTIKVLKTSIQWKKNRKPE